MSARVNEEVGGRGREALELLGRHPNPARSDRSRQGCFFVGYFQRTSFYSLCETLLLYGLLDLVVFVVCVSWNRLRVVVSSCKG